MALQPTKSCLYDSWDYIDSTTLRVDKHDDSAIYPECSAGAASPVLPDVYGQRTQSKIFVILLNCVDATA